MSETTILKQQIEQYQQMLEVMPAGVIVLDKHGVICETNSEAERILGCSLLGLCWSNVISDFFAPKLDDGHEISLKNGKKVKLAISLSGKGQLILLTDLTETRLLQDRVSQMQRMSSLGQMVASLAHQVRTPLASAMLYAANLASENLAPKVKAKFQVKLLERLKDLEKQVSDMLLFAKGNENQVVSKFSIDQLLDETESIVETILMQNDVDFSIDCTCEDSIILGNKNALANAISNLVINSVQIAGTKCKIAIDVRMFEERFLFSVIDNGPGIALDMQKKIMEPFFTTRQQGTGLGLAVVQMVCNAHKGKLRLISNEGEGACFIIDIPQLEN